MADPHVISMLYEVLVAQSKYESRGIDYRTRLKANYYQLLRENRAHKDAPTKYPKQSTNKLLLSLADSVRVLDPTELQTTDLELCYGINQYVFPKIPDFDSLDANFVSKWHKFYNVLPVYQRAWERRKRPNEKKHFPMSKRRNVKDSESSSEDEGPEPKATHAVLMTEEDFDNPKLSARTEDPYEEPSPQARDPGADFPSHAERDEGHVKLPIVMNKDVEVTDDAIVFGLMEDYRLSDWVSTSSFDMYKELYRQVYFYDSSLRMGPIQREDMASFQKDEDSEHEREAGSAANVKSEAAAPQPEKMEPSSVYRSDAGVRVFSRSDADGSLGYGSDAGLKLANNTGSGVRVSYRAHPQDRVAGASAAGEKAAHRHEAVVGDRAVNGPDCASKAGNKQDAPERLTQGQDGASKQVNKQDFVATKSASKQDATNNSSSKQDFVATKSANKSANKQNVGASKAGTSLDSSSNTNSSDEVNDELIGTRNFYKKAKPLTLPGKYKQDTDHFDPDAIFGNYYCPLSSGTTFVDSLVKVDTLGSNNSNETSAKTDLAEMEKLEGEKDETSKLMNVKSFTVNFMEVDSIYSCNDLGNFEVRCSAKIKHPFASGVMRRKMEGTLGVYQELQVLLKKLFSLKRKISGNCSICSGWNLLHGIAHSFCEYCEDKLVNRDPEILLKIFEIRRYLVSILYPIVGYNFQTLELFKTGELAHNWKDLIRTQKVSIQSLTEVGSSFPKASLHDSRCLPSPITLPHTICDTINTFQFPKTNQFSHGQGGASSHSPQGVSLSQGHPQVAGLSGQSSQALLGLSGQSSQALLGLSGQSSQALLSQTLLTQLGQSTHIGQLVQQVKEELLTPINTPTKQSPFGSGPLKHSPVNNTQSGNTAQSVNSGVSSTKGTNGCREAFNIEGSYGLMDIVNYRRYHKAKMLNDFLEQMYNEYHSRPAHKRSTHLVNNYVNIVKNGQLLTTEFIIPENASLDVDSEDSDETDEETPELRQNEGHESRYSERNGDKQKEKGESRPGEKHNEKADPKNAEKQGDRKKEPAREGPRVREFKPRETYYDEDASFVLSRLPLDTDMIKLSFYHRGVYQCKTNSLKTYAYAHVAKIFGFKDTGTNVISTRNSSSRSSSRSSSNSIMNTVNTDAGATTAYATVNAESTTANRGANMTTVNATTTANTTTVTTGASVTTTTANMTTVSTGAPTSADTTAAYSTAAKATAVKANGSIMNSGHMCKDEPTLTIDLDDAGEVDASGLAQSTSNEEDNSAGLNYGWHEHVVRNLSKKAFLVKNNKNENSELISRMLSEEGNDGKVCNAELLRKLHRYKLLQNMPTQVLSGLRATGKLNIGFPTSLEMFVLNVPDSIMDCGMYGGVGKSFMYSLDAIVHNLALLSTIIRVGTVSNVRKKNAK
ncbi:conserved hypothetical protein [Theileria orientalis strain Shintoku]|uniref:Uncharacterized protein n=1 Tax=Theileria orientalis strain Shintoku TaxID=869250 RepID=J4DP94_THEOR|nr:conserved hypothetical protein [Theileria orientalis strain Shintoku]BAM40309.1 conserved hypothetical protein [Theileria orientalis strain Shintoku]|eukprot:XP_009690610.1 conserved hypothetical protein [Theileria orientalis strain Shintoku]